MDSPNELFRATFDFSSALVFFPVRHHSPACARHLEKTIAAYDPDIILIEGPSDAERLIPYIADAASRPPFAIYCSFEDSQGLVSGENERYRAYYPFLDYSPEYLAIRAAAGLGKTARFIDMPYAERLVRGKAGEAQRYRYNEDEEYESNSYTAALARNAGYRSYAEFWDAYYELPDQATETFVRSLCHVAWYMREASSNEELAEDLLRETYMASRIAGARKESDKILVVCGAFHVPGLAETGAAAAPASTPEKLPALKTSHYLMPYTFTEMDGRKGYGAGMPFPAYWEAIWKCGRDLPAEEAFEKTASDFIVKTARFTRATSPVSVPDEVNAMVMAKNLARLRGKAAPGVYELIDGIQSAFVKGDINTTQTSELDYLFRLLSGLGAGAVAASDQVPPIVLDFRARCGEYRLRTDTVLRQETTLDILKNPAHFRKSVFFHQLAFLEAGFCRFLSGPDYVNGKDKNLVREKWEYTYTSAVETALIDLSVFGATLAEAAGTIAARQFRDSLSAAELGRLLVSAVVMGLEGFFETWRETIIDIIDREGHFISEVSCLGSLRYLKKLSAVFSAADTGQDRFIEDLQIRCFRRSCDLLEEGRSVQGDEEKKAADSLRSLYAFSVESFGPEESRISAESRIPQESIAAYFADKVEELLDSGFSGSRFHGALLALHEKQGRIGIDELGRRIRSRLESSPPEDAASFLAGVFLVGRDVVFSDSGLIRSIDRVIHGMEHGDFLAALPNLRQAFTFFLPAEIDRIGRMAAELYGVESGEILKMEQIGAEEVVLGMKLDRIADEDAAKWFESAGCV